MGTNDKRVYLAPQAVGVGKITELTKGHGTPVGDPPHDGTTGYYNAAGDDEEKSADLDS